MDKSKVPHFLAYPVLCQRLQLLLQPPL